MTDAPFVMVAPTGARRSKADHPGLPITPEEIAQTAKACHRAGADALHLHVRDDAGQHSLDVGRYRAAIDAVQATVPEMVIQVTTEAAGRFGPQEQFAMLKDLKPRWASASLRELAREPDVAIELYAMCEDQGIHIQHIVYDAEDAALLAQYQSQDVLGREESVILVLGSYTGTEQSHVDALRPLVAALPPVRRWMLCAFGSSEHACLRAAAAMGGDVRVGFENALSDSKGNFWDSVETSVGALIRPWRSAA